MRKLFLFGIVVFALLSAACEHSDDVRIYGNWTKMVASEAVERSGAVSFTIGTKAYVGLGIDKDLQELNDFWSYADGVWTKVENFPGEKRMGAVAFVLDGKAYIGGGYQPENYSKEFVFFTDFYRFDPAAEPQWAKIEDFPGAARGDALAFALNGKGYVGCGFDRRNRDLKDFWTYAEGKGWEKLEGFPGDPRRGGVAFVLENKAYICTGESNGRLALDMISYEPAKNEWKKLHPLVNFNKKESFDDDYGEIPRAYTSCFLAKTSEGSRKAYIVSGFNSLTGRLLRSCWEYDARIDRWKRCSYFSSYERFQAVGFSLGDYGYIGFGGISRDRGHFSDLWQFTPDVENDMKTKY